MAETLASGVPELAATLASFVKDSRVPGAAAGVVTGDGLAWSAAAGFADVASRRAPTATTLYRIASITKTFTGTAILQLRDAGKLGLDDPAVSWLPELREAESPFAAIEAVTIRRLLSHESGLASEPPGTDWATPVYQGAAERTLRHAAGIAVRLPPNTQHKYSNLGYQLLGEIVARVTGTPYPRYVSEAILGPLGMTATGFDPLAEPLPARGATGYASRAFSDDLGPAPATPQVWAEGGLWSCVEDLAKWVRFQLSAHQDPAPDPAAPAPTVPPVLAPATLREMHKPRYLDDDEWTRASGISWLATRRDDVVWIGHSGGIPGFTTAVCFDPKEQAGAIALVNGDGDTAALAMDLAAIARHRVRARPPVIRPPAPAPNGFRPLLGIYALPDMSQVIRLEWRDGKLTFTDPQLPALSLTLAPTSDPNAFTVEPGWRQSGEPVTFQRLADGRVASAYLANATFLRLDRVHSGAG